MADVGGLRWRRGPGLTAAVALACAGTGALASAAACGQGFSATGDDGGPDTGGEGGSGDAPPTDGAPPSDAGYDGPRADGSCLDCSDPACEGVSCAGIPPPGWTLVAASFGDNPGECPPVYGPATDLLVAGGPQTCGCDCDGGSVSCGGPPVFLAYGLTGTCATGSVMVNTAPGCYPIDGGLPLGPWALLPPIQAQTTACLPTWTNDVPPEGKVRVCPVAGAGGGCSDGKECVAVASPFLLCLEQPGDVACPPDHGNKSTLGATITDKRSCTSCTCSPQPGACTGETLSGWSGASCNGIATSLAADGMCHMVAGGGPFLSYDYSATGQGGGCMSSGSTAVGSEMIGGPSTLCCP